MLRKRRGFTLLEMLTAIIVIVMLSAVMIMSTLEVTASADANNIISNMNLIRTAVLMWYKQNSSRLVPNSSVGYKIKTGEDEQSFADFIKYHNSEILKYLDNKYSLIIRSTSSDGNDTGDYTLIAVNKTKQWYVYVCYNLGTTSATSDMEAQNIKIKSKLAGNAKTIGLLGKVNIADGNFNGTYTNQKFACMHVLTLAK